MYSDGSHYNVVTFTIHSLQCSYRKFINLRYMCDFKLVYCAMVLAFLHAYLHKIPVLAHVVKDAIVASTMFKSSTGTLKWRLRETSAIYYSCNIIIFFDDPFLPTDTTGMTYIRWESALAHKPLELKCCILEEQVGHSTTYKEVVLSYFVCQTINPDYTSMVHLEYRYHLRRNSQNVWNRIWIFRLKSTC